LCISAATSVAIDWPMPDTSAGEAPLASAAIFSASSVSPHTAKSSINPSNIHCGPLESTLRPMAI